MINRTLSEIVNMSGGSATNVEPDLRINGFSTDTRTIEPGVLYIPLIGANFDGHYYVKDAIAKGAVASFWQNDHANPPADCNLIFVEDTLQAMQQLANSYRNQLNVKIVGITGSNGKTTTKDLVASVLSTSFNVHKTIGNLNNHFGVPMTLLSLKEDTEVAVLEMGMSDRGEIELLSKLAEPDIAIITMIGDSHMLQLGSRKEIARAKVEIIEGLRLGGTFIYYGDEPLIEEVLEELNAKSRNMNNIRFGVQEDNEYYPQHIQMQESGTSFKVGTLANATLYIPLLGAHNVTNALAAIAVAKALGVSDEKITEGLSSVQMTSMRIEKLQAQSGLTVLNDAYNASPASMKAAITLLHELNGYNRKFIVLGDMLELGPDEEEYHHQIGTLLQPERLAGVFTYGALSHHIAEGARANFADQLVHEFTNKEELIANLRGIVEPNDVVLVKGSRGMKLEQVVQSLL
ncbi:UDP-N-acetylmuramoyl-tripeptide--D-alanyl-D-alanine ligase [Paenibacillus sp. N1-5-1-14]|uniref:UDP-N-acetylmuramoyl-tripeptide--D-alanyl-D- alanine ligase n=1 Tax=Paenibacillus radicibacter TaxID=2972488 RepID=UPI002159231E|nr:UDP-N-acetylmuramoyl-tripeptide--D-alanyl-D-alanine ligase [Paenibacillus radicibacter]MCR8641920.1 UDP-N-acetylmuramoyl-tripeptide--D-alanyl-D-alanine ligase [Paenibacillus radicibacter]